LTISVLFETPSEYPVTFIGAGAGAGIFALIVVVVGVVIIR
jgi:hypothetical protein